MSNWRLTLALCLLARFWSTLALLTRCSRRSSPSRRMLRSRKRSSWSRIFSASRGQRREGLRDYHSEQIKAFMSRHLVPSTSSNRVRTHLCYKVICETEAGHVSLAHVRHYTTVVSVQIRRSSVPAYGKTVNLSRSFRSSLHKSGVKSCHHTPVLSNGHNIRPILMRNGRHVRQVIEEQDSLILFPNDS